MFLNVYKIILNKDIISRPFLSYKHIYQTYSSTFGIQVSNSNGFWGVCINCTYVVGLQLDSVFKDIRCEVGFLEDCIKCFLILGRQRMNKKWSISEDYRKQSIKGRCRRKSVTSQKCQVTPRFPCYRVKHLTVTLRTEMGNVLCRSESSQVQKKAKMWVFMHLVSPCLWAVPVFLHCDPAGPQLSPGSTSPTGYPQSQPSWPETDKEDEGEQTRD